MRPTSSKTAGSSEKDADPSRKKVYRWEDDWPGWNKNTLSLRSCRAVIVSACHAYDVAPPAVRQHGDGLSWSEPEDENVISFQSKSRRPGNGGKNLPVALHEAAHHIVFHLHGKRVQDHGPTFMRVYLDLLTRFRVAPRLALEVTARKWGLRW